jgi:2-haloacid dehalogenase
MLKRCFFLLILLSSSYIPAIQPATIPIIVAWDLHSVLFKRVFPWHQRSVKPNSDTFDLVQAIADKGIEQHILSNIDLRSLEKVIERHPELFSFFDLSKSQVKERGIEKPHDIFYHNYLKRNGIDPTKTLVIFIDDKKRNIIGAEKNGMYGIQFISPEQVKEELVELGIL